MDLAFFKLFHVFVASLLISLCPNADLRVIHMLYNKLQFFFYFIVVFDCFCLFDCFELSV